MEIFLQTVSALNDETRVLILRFLDEYGRCCVCELQQSLQLNQSRLSRHLKILKDAGFLKMNREGKWVYYEIKEPIDRFRREALKEIAHLDIKLPRLIKKEEGCAPNFDDSI